MDKAKKQEIIKEYGNSENDSGSTEVQVALLTERIKELTEHCKAHPQDNHSRRGLMMLVQQRRNFLKYLNRKSHSRYMNCIKALNLRH